MPLMARTRPLLMQIGLGPEALEPMGMTTASTLLFQDSKKAMTLQADRECDLLAPNTREMGLPKPKRAVGKRGRGKASGGGGGGFGAKSAPALSAEQRATALRAEAVESDGVCLVPGVLGKESAAKLYDCLRDELAKAYEAVRVDKMSSVGRFNVPAETFDPSRGYLLLPLRDEQSVADAVDNGPLVSSLRELLASDAKLGELFSTMCGGADAELYDVCGLRTEAGASRQPIHFDTPYQKVPGLFCAFIAVHDIRYSMGTTVFIPGTHKNCAQRRAIVEGHHDGRREAMLGKADSHYSLLQAGDAAFFDMRTLHAGTANLEVEEGGGQRLIFILTFRDRRAREELGHAPNLRPDYRHRGITLGEMRRELASDAPFAGVASDGREFGDGLSS